MDNPVAPPEDQPASGLRRRSALVGLAGGGIALGILAFGKSRLLGSQQRVVTPERFANAASADDAAPMIQAAIEDVAAAGGGTVRLTAGKTYRLRAVVPGSDVTAPTFRASLAVPPAAANVTLDLNGATLLQDSDAFTFGTTYRMFNDRVMENTRRTVTRVPRQGDTSVAVQDTAGLGPGSRVMIVSGNVNRKAYVPIAEMARVVAVRNGSVDLDRPIGKNHELAKGKMVGLIDVTRDSASNIALVGPGRIVNSYRRAGHFIQIDGFRMANVDFEGSGGFSIRGRDIDVTDCRATIKRGANDAFRPFAIAFDTGSSHIRLSRFKAVGLPLCYIHLHEGLSDVVLSDIEIRNQWQPDPSWINVAAISILGTSWNVELDNVLIVNNPQGAGIGAGGSKVMQGGNYGLTLHNITLQGEFRNPALAINDQNPVRISGLDVRNATVASGRSPVRLVGARHQVSDVTE